MTETTPNLPVGTSCTVTEGAFPPLGLVDDSYAWGPSPATQTVIVDTKGGVTAVTVTNRVDRAFGSLDVTKVVNGLNGVDGAQTTFSGDVELHHRRRDQERHVVPDRRRSGHHDRRRGPGPADLHVHGHRGRPPRRRSRATRRTPGAPRPSAAASP